MRRPLIGLAALGAVGALTLSACSSTSSSSSAASAATGSSKAPITIADIVSTTGSAGSEYVRAPQGFLARIAQQNAEGGVDGHKLVPVLVNDGGNFSQETSIVQGAVETKGAFGVVSNTPFMFAGYRWLQQNGIPVTGSSADGPEWTEPQNSNMFASDADPITENDPASELTKLYELAAGKSASIAALGYSISPLSTQGATDAVEAAKDGGLKAPYLNNDITFGSTSFTAEALAIKQSGANLVVPELDADSDFALIQDLKQDDAKATGVLAVGMGPSVIKSPAWSDLQGSIFFQTWVPTQLHTPATVAFQAALEKYEHIPTSDFPDWAVYEGWLGADLMIKGLEMDGPNPTRAGVIAKLHTLTDYTGGGLLGAPINYSIIQKKAETDCLYALKAEKSGFVPLSTKPVCGLPYPSSGSSS